MSKKLKIILLVVLVIVIAGFIFYSLRKESGDSIEVSVADVERGSITRVVSGSGQIQPETSIDISARISAEVTMIHVQEGESVTRGQLLVELDRERYVAIVEQAQSTLLSAQAEYKRAKADYQRVKDLFDKELTSQADLDAAEANLLSAESSVQRTRANLKQAKDDLAKTSIKAPITGTVVKLYKEEGEIAVGSQFQADPILNVADLTKMEVLAEIDENDVVFVSNGDYTKIEVDAIPDTTFEGVVTEIAHMATTRGRGTQEQVTNFEVKIGVTSDVSRLRPGMSATVDIHTETRDSILYVPIQCVTARQISAEKDTSKVEDAQEKETNETVNQDKEPNRTRKEVVFLVEKETNTVKRVQVQTGISDDTHIEIKSGLNEGQQVVSGSYKALSQQLKDGSVITIKEDVGYREQNQSE
ncbi:efflux RND transporter periplasmic adaptor subunit [candidate division KSB1 bacterium]|jgi:HlyD family secretion protein|nr:efflux RND transporter periplasmic adaptor subunit [candidate division KSB1 bacterium]